ncbi:hypothetical protein SHKM778_95750 (plasmid) [Streptomyces sp. KM77-8]|uniref:Uncharacterized protein n=1 Tax=Streptomyces haneummycinicus TaxID=3074435 RepID=A0AAT9I0R3_9ACTN
MGTDASGLDEPLVDGGGDVSARGIDPAGEVGCVVAAGLGGSVGAFLGVVGALDDIAADTGRVGAAAGRVDIAGLGQADGEGQTQALAGGFGDEGRSREEPEAMAWAPTRPVPEPVGVIRTALLRTRARVPAAVVRRVMWRAARAVSSGRSVMPALWTAARTCRRAPTKAAPLFFV